MNYRCLHPSTFRLCRVRNRSQTYRVLAVPRHPGTQECPTRLFTGPCLPGWDRGPVTVTYSQDFERSLHFLKALTDSNIKNGRTV